MTPDQILIIKSLADIMKQIGTWPIGTVLVIITLGPWVFSWFDSRTNEKRLEAAIKLYEDNVTLVKDYKSLVDGYRKIVDGQQDLIIHTTQILTTVKEIAENNLYCPMVRKETKPQKPYG